MITLVLCVCGIMVLVWLVWLQWLSTPDVQVEAVMGEAILENRFNRDSLLPGTTLYMSVNSVLKTTSDNSSVLISFSNGETIFLTGQKEISLIAKKRYGNEKVYIFRENSSGKSFNYSTKYGLDRVNAAVIAVSDVSGVGKVMGVRNDQKVNEEFQSLDDQQKVELFKQLALCLENTFKAEYQANEENTSNYETVLYKCLQKYSLTDLETLR